MYYEYVRYVTTCIITRFIITKLKLMIPQYIYMYIRTYICTYVHTYICTYVHMYVHVCMYVCMCVYVYVYTYYIHVGNTFRSHTDNKVIIISIELMSR